MSKIIRENGYIWLETIQTSDGKHRRRDLIGTYDEKEEKEDKKQKKEKSDK